MKETNDWNAVKYNEHADFVSNLAMPVVDLLEPKKDERILDLGCGEGTLAYEIQKYSSKVIAIDLSDDMVKKTKAKGIEAYVMSAVQINYTNEFDAVFSNAVLHWVKEDEIVIKKIHKSLKQNGRFVAEFGAFTNIQALVDAISEVFNKNKKYGKFNNPWYFKKQNEYKKLLESNGFKVQYIKTIKRPTKIDDMSNWLNVFANGIIEHLTNEQQDSFKNEVRNILKPKLYTKENGWIIPYVRLRIRAYKIG